MPKLTSPVFRCLAIALTTLFCLTGLFASEHGGSVYPAGAEGFLIASAEPGKGQTQVQNYNCFYMTTRIDDAHGRAVTPAGFELISVANAVKLSHNWGVHFLGGELGSYIAIPNVYQRLSGAGQTYAKDAIGNFNIAPFAVYMHKGAVFQTYEIGFEPAGSGYDANGKLNIGQHNVAITPAYAITVMPNHGKTDLQPDDRRTRRLLLPANHRRQAERANFHREECRWFGLRWLQGPEAISWAANHISDWHPGRAIGEVEP